MYIFNRILNFISFQVEKWAVKERTCIGFSKLYPSFKIKKKFTVIQIIQDHRKGADSFL